MKQAFTMQLMKGAMIGYIPIDDYTSTIERKSKTWTQVYSFEKPVLGQIGFNFSKSDNRLLGIEIYYARFCLSNEYVEFAEYFRDKETAEIQFDTSPGLTLFYFDCDSEGTRTKQIIYVAPPAVGTAVIAFREEKLCCIELIGFDCALEKLAL
ncbi:MAG: hypothetical protein J0H83_01775 [Candidatus Melainabacteria bacterium]|jgi:hypothetical protein|nr:hypothetical protein [Candidatus Melainabacteria bacterium]